MKKIFFTPGPSELFYTVSDHLKKGLKDNIYSISHRSNEFKKIYEECTFNLKTLLKIPDDYNIGFLSSANEIWERLINNLILNNSVHLVNGSFSKKFYNFAVESGINATKYIFDNEEYNIDDIENDSEIIALTLNETSTGIMCPSNKISEIRNKFKESFILLDCVSGIPSLPFNIKDVDTFYFSVQKCFGLPSGLGVWVYNNRCLDRHNELRKSKKTGTYHSLHRIHEMSLKCQTPETPNVLAIYLLSKVTEDMIKIGIDNIRRDTIYKSSLLYNTIKKHQNLSCYVNDKNIRSKTVIVSNTQKDNDLFIDGLKRKNLIVGKGYGSSKNQIRIANFPTHSKEVFELLCDELIKL
tara:strand:+ start:3684 stop:4745 length:1062 start_codon:yes stop_codon:yes gene_type:complete